MSWQIEMQSTIDLMDVGTYYFPGYGGTTIAHTPGPSPLARRIGAWWSQGSLPGLAAALAGQGCCHSVAGLLARDVLAAGATDPDEWWWLFLRCGDGLPQHSVVAHRGQGLEAATVEETGEVVLVARPLGALLDMRGAWGVEPRSFVEVAAWLDGALPRLHLSGPRVQALDDLLRWCAEPLPPVVGRAAEGVRL